jgi:hypothetical protein
MADITFAQLLEIYRRASFDAQAGEATIFVETPEILDLLKQIDSDERAKHDSNIHLLDGDTDSLAVGQRVRAQIAHPKIALGILAPTLDKLLFAPKAFLAEPKAYFVIEGKLEPTSTQAPLLAGYRKILEIVDLFKQAASYVDEIKQELIFIRDGKFAIPVRFSEKTIQRLSTEDADNLLNLFEGDLHKEQKLLILIEAIAHISEAQSEAKRFEFIIDNLKSVACEISNGYKLFISSFSYSKIRTEIADKKIEYVTKIHKTLVDIQGQLLGIPVATVIAATQLKSAQKCGLEFWTNIGVLAGVWVFVALLMVSIINQWHTLNSISEEVNNQKSKLHKEYASISDKFSDLFDDLTGRIKWHKGTLWLIGFIALAGAGISTVAYSHLNTAGFSACAFAVQPPEKVVAKTPEQSNAGESIAAKKIDVPADAGPAKPPAQVPKQPAAQPGGVGSQPKQPSN